MTRKQIQDEFGDVVTEMPLGKKYTDDTEMTLILARHLCNNMEVQYPKLHVEYGKGMTDKGYSSHTRQILTLCGNGNIWQPKGMSSCDGAVMRIAPLGLVSHRDDAHLFQQLDQALFLTHADSKDAVMSAFVHCKLIHALITERFSNKYELFSYMVNKARIHPPLFTKLNLVRYCLNVNPPVENITAELLGDSNHFQIQAIDCLACAVYTFFRFYDNPKEAVCYAASMGGDTDTIAKVTGDLCGALHGTEWIPESWKGVEGEAELISLGEKLGKIQI